MMKADPTGIHSPSKERLRLWLRILKTSRGIEAQLRGRFRDKFNSTLPRFDVLAALSRHHDGLKMSQLSGVLRVSNGNVTGIVDRLVDEGLVIRIAVEGDRRASLVRLTQKGKIEFAAQAAAHEGWINQLLETLDENAAAAMGAQLDQLLSSMEATND